MSVLAGVGLTELVGLIPALATSTIGIGLATAAGIAQGVQAIGNHVGQTQEREQRGNAEKASSGGIVKRRRRRRNGGRPRQLR